MLIVRRCEFNACLLKTERADGHTRSSLLVVGHKEGLIRLSFLSFFVIC